MIATRIYLVGNRRPLSPRAAILVVGFFTLALWSALVLCAWRLL